MRETKKKPRKKAASKGAKKTPVAARGSVKTKNPKLPRVRWLSLKTIPSCRQALARIAKEYKLHLISETEARAMTYCLRGVLAALESERDMAVEQRLADLLLRLEALEGKRKT
jgi:hypothetical protein